jgi:hypothetical protein
MSSANNIPLTFSKNKKLPEPIEVQPNGQPYVSWGKDNLYAQNFLNRLFYESPYQSGIIRQKCYFITGGGYEITFNKPEDKAIWDAFEASSPRDSKTQDNINDNCLDAELYNGIAVRGVYNRGGGIAYFESMDFDTIRVSPNGLEYYYSDDWGLPFNKQTPEDTGFKMYKPYNPLDKKNDFLIYYAYPSKEFRQKKKKTDSGLYPKPIYSGALKDISTDIEMSSYHFHEILNGMKAGNIIYLGSGEPKTPQDKTAIEDAIKGGTTEIETSGGIILMYGKGDDQKPFIANLNGNDLDKRYLMTEEAVEKKIFIAHSVVIPTMFGIPSKAGLGNATELEFGYNIFVANYVRARQQALESVYNFILQTVLKLDATITLKEGVLTPEGQVVEETPAPQVTEQGKHSENDMILKALLKAGRKRKEFVVLSTRQMPESFTAEEEKSLSKAHWKDVHKTSYNFAELLSDFHLNILKLINDGHNQAEISEALEVKIKKVAEAYEELQAKKLISKKGELNNRGIKALESTPAPLDNFEIRYSYEKKTGVSGGDKLPGNRTRPFCSQLIDADRLYTREEINLIGNAVGRDVWAYRGGWWTQPDGTHSPSCRHIWKQNVIFKP